MNNAIKLSVVIPCLNAEATLPTQLTALSAQTWTELWEVVVVDNGSSDRSISIAHAFQNRLPALTIVVANKRKGAAHARNVGVTAAQSDNIAFCDADDEVAADWVRIMGEGVKRYGIVYGRFRFEKFNDPLTASQSNKVWENGLYKGRFLPGGGSGNLGIRRPIHQAIGGFEESLPRSEDADYYWRLQLEGFRLHFLPKAVVQVRRERVNYRLRQIYRRRKDTVASNYWSYQRYKHMGMLPPPPITKSLAAWAKLVKPLIRMRLRSKRHQAVWLKQFTHHFGEIVGQLEGRLRTPCKPYQPKHIALTMKR